MSNLDINTPLGQESLEEERKMAKLFQRHHVWQRYINTNKAGKAAVDAVLLSYDNILGLVEQKSRKFTLEEMTKLGYDTYVMAADVIVPLLREASLKWRPKADPRVARAADQLQAWNRRSGADSVAYTYLHYWAKAYRELSSNEQFNRFNSYERGRIDIRSAREQDMAWRALEAAVARIESRFGRPEVPWGEINVVVRDSVRGTGRGAARSSAFFEFDKAVIYRGSDQTTLNQVAEILKAHPEVKLAIDGHITTGKMEGLETIALAFSGILLIESLLSFVEVFLLQSVGQRVMADMRKELFQHVMNLPVSWFDHVPTGSAVTRLTSDVEVLGEMFASGIITIVGDILLLAGIVSVMLWMNPKLSLVTFSVLPLLGYVAYTFRRRMRQSFREVRARLARLNSFLAESLGGMTVVQLFRREQTEQREFSRLNGAYRDANLPVITWDASLYALVETLSVVAVGLIIWYGGGEIVRDALYRISEAAQTVADLDELFRQLTADIADDILATPARFAEFDGNENVPAMTWDGAPIQLCFVDCGRLYAVNQSWYQLLRSSFLRDKTLLVMQDWQHHKTVPEIWWEQMKVFTDSKGSEIELIHEVTGAGIGTFLFRG